MAGKPIDPEREQTEGSQPEIVVSYKPAGRETLEAIAAELVPLPTPVEREGSSPEIVVHEGNVGRETLAAIVYEAATSEPAAKTNTARQAVSTAAVIAVPAAAQGAASLEIFEMMTYVVRGGDIARLASETSRRRFVEEQLLARLPVSSMADVERIDVTPWTVPGTLVVRVWCRTKPSD